ncbi:hypothetical protein CRX72_10630 [Pantoea sp. BRM17]|nr:hypothetical protein CRX72_10630 [Pantoea sp. BRM17]
MHAKLVLYAGGYAGGDHGTGRCYASARRIKKGATWSPLFFIFSLLVICVFAVAVYIQTFTLLLFRYAQADTAGLRLRP